MLLQPVAPRRSTRPAPFAFTLIELLIVVAIIAILAAIAVPNFLEAQTRAKVSRTLADMRSVATAMEAYQVDANDYPPTNRKVGVGAFDGIVPIERRFVPLTSPISYITSIPKDVFGDQVDFSTYLVTPLRYGVFDFVRFPREAPNAFDNLVFKRDLVANGFSVNMEWYMASQGPDLEPGLAASGITQNPSGRGTGVPYDPTNGTVSFGDIIRVGPGGDVIQ